MATRCPPPGGTAGPRFCCPGDSLAFGATGSFPLQQVGQASPDSTLSRNPCTCREAPEAVLSTPWGQGGNP